jgi:hypothetical protein
MSKARWFESFGLFFTLQTCSKIRIMHYEIQSSPLPKIATGKKSGWLTCESTATSFDFRDFADLLGCIRGKWFGGHDSELLAR